LHGLSVHSFTEWKEAAMPITLAPLKLLEALTTPHDVDRYTQLFSPMLTVRELRAKVELVQRPTADSTRLTLRPTRQWQGFRAGQFVQVGVLIGGRWHTRCYSPANSHHTADGRIELTVKAHAGGLVSQHLYSYAKPGLVLQLGQASGSFVLPDERPERVLLVSGGSGITPVLSMLRTLIDENYGGEVTFLHYADSPRHVAYRAELFKLANTRPDIRIAFGYRTDDPGLDGLFGLDHLAEVAPWFADEGTQTFLCGPAGLMDSVRAFYAERDLSDRLHAESFVTTLAPVLGEASGVVSFDASRTQAKNSGETLLEQAEAAGLSPEFGCRMGICFSCTAVKTSGCTRNVLTGELNDDPDTEIQICVNAPVGDVIVGI
jgi:ferredoxin-NADP reductase